MPENGSPLLLTSSKVADLLGVHPSTVKRWCDEGSLPSERTTGGHRRVRLNDTLDTARTQGISTLLDLFHPWEANVWLAVTEAEEKGRFDRLHNLAFSWLSNGSPDLMGRLLHLAASRPGIPFPFFLDQGLRGFMARVGEEWISGRLGIGEEHMASQIVMEVLIRLRPGWDDLGRSPVTAKDPIPTAVVGTMEGDHHDLGAQAVRVVLEREGWRVYYLGADVPIEEFAEIQRAQGADLVCISFSPRNILPDLHRAVRVLSEFYRPDFPYALGLGGSLGNFSGDMVKEAPFRSLAAPESTQEFIAWTRSLRNDVETAAPRRVA